jgi:hypothetical protein
MGRGSGIAYRVAAEDPASAANKLGAAGAEVVESHACDDIQNSSDREINCLPVYNVDGI